MEDIAKSTDANMALNIAAEAAFDLDEARRMMWEDIKAEQMQDDESEEDKFNRLLHLKQ